MPEKNSKNIIKFFNLPEKHPSSEKIWQELQKKDPKIKLSEVEILLEKLVKSGKISQIFDNKNQKLYHKKSADHFHFICEDCGVVKNVILEKGAMEMIMAHFQKKVHSFGKVGKINMSFQGQCFECRPNKKRD